MDSSTIPSTRFSTRQFDVWRESIAVVFDVERLPGDAGATFDASVDAFQLGEMVVTSASLGGQRYVRSPARVRRDGMDHFVFNLYRTGGWKAQTPRREFEGKAGQVSVLDLSSELISDEPNSSLVALFVPRSLLEERLPNLAALHGSAPSGPHAVLLAEYLDMLVRRLPTLPGGDEQALSRATCEMLTACLAPSLVNVEAARPGLELVLQRRAKRFIEAHLNSSELSTDAICNAVGVSRRTLYRLFDQEGGVLHYVRSRRLERIRAVLADPRETRRISEIAAEFGFLRSDHFARAFKHQYGQSARDLRDLMHRHPETYPETSPVVPGENQGFDDWIRSLLA
ncbi:AraC family transcriptional regulator [Mesorhizobium plurifarium]|uniref:helix-turn-helix domain-containing protein n=1 Tax=Sinorhizobium arboris TaxID=76745 RepID=UPI00047FDCE4|nr:helix-turn-helix domain-containing protein [Sinorhizobium arboris]PST26363.1 AraC family transcriptional regulator [Mesorhizobium plurifarium]